MLGSKAFQGRSLPFWWFISCYLGTWASISTIQGQTQTTDWLTGGQQWIRIRTSDNGLIRLRASDLPELPVNIQPQNLHLYHRGTELAIYIEKANESPFFSGDDLIEFLCTKNDGQLEAMLYRDPVTGRPAPELAPTTYVSQFDDTAAYFLTWNAVERGRHFSYSNIERTGVPLDPARGYTARVRLDFDVHNGIYLTGGGGQYDPLLDMNSDYVTGEGYLDRPFNRNAIHVLNVPQADLTSLDSALIITRLVGRNYIRHRVRLSVGLHAVEQTYDNISYQTCSLRIPVSELASGQITVTLTALGGNTSVGDINAICWIECQYPRRLTFNEPIKGEIVRWNSESTDWQTLTLRADYPESRVWAYDPIARTRQVRVPDANGQMVFFSHPQATSRELWFFSFAEVNSALQDVQAFTPNVDLLNPPDVELIVLTHRGLIRSAQAYASYRRHEAPRPTSTQLVLVEDLYDHFSYGSSHPQAIKDYMRRHLVKSSPSLKFVMFWGQGRYAKTWGKAHVPTWGYPASDQEFVSRFDDDCQEETPLAALGRVNILTDEQGFAYLDKLAQYENQPHQAWMQRIIHAGGGANIGEQTSIERFLIRNDSLVSSVGLKPFRYQNRMRPIPDESDLPDRDQVMREGALFVQAFGHTDHNATDVLIREPSWYANDGRFYVMMMNGCYSSDFANSPAIGTLGERFIRQPKAGAVAFLASSGVGYVQVMGTFTQRFYQLAFQDSIHLSLGEVIQQTVSSYTRSGQNLGQIWRNQLRQFHLQGCPVLSMQTPAHPDFSFAARYLRLDPPKPGLGDTLLRFELEVRNTGRYCPDTIELVVEHWAELSGLPPIAIQRIQLLPFNRSTSVSLPLHLSSNLLKPGLNRLQFRLNPSRYLTELNFNNNVYDYEWVLPGRQPLIVYPANYAVVGSDTLTLTAMMPGIAPTQPVTCWFEIDTLPDFSSPFCKRSESLVQPAVRLAWTPSLVFADSQVYFWRMRIADMPVEQWVRSSFQWIANRSGWGQAHPAQLVELDRDGLTYSTSPPLWAGTGEAHDLTVGVWPNVFSISKHRQRASEAIDFRFWMTTLFYSVVDRNRLEVLTVDSTFGIVKPLDPVRDTTTLKQVIDDLTEDQLLVLFSKLPQFNLWPESNVYQLDRVGKSMQIDSIRLAEAFCTGFILIGQKGMKAGAANERFLFGPSNGVTIDSTLIINSARGTVRTLRIGPAFRWGELTANVETPTDAAWHQFHLVGRNASGHLDSLGRWPEVQLRADLGHLRLDPQKTLQLAWEVAGESGDPLPQLRRWHLLFEPLPDFALSLADSFPGIHQLRTGTTISIPLTAWLVHGPPVDSLALVVEWTDSTGFRQIAEQIWIRNLRDRQNIAYYLKLPDVSGFYRVKVELNPSQLTPELYVFNNRIEFTVELFEVPDTTAPRLEVFLNDVRARNGMAIQPNPRIKIQLSDDPGDVPLNRSSDCIVGIRWQNPVDLLWIDYDITSLRGNLSFHSLYQPGLINQAFWTLNFQQMQHGLWELIVQPNGPADRPWILDEYRLQFIVHQSQEHGQWGISPNPASRQFSLISPKWGQHKPSSIRLELIDGTGRRVLSSEFSTNWDHHQDQLTLDVVPDEHLNTTLPAGVYFWRVLSLFSDRHEEKSPFGKLIWMGY